MGIEIRDFNLSKNWYHTHITKLSLTNHYFIFFSILLKNTEYAMDESTHLAQTDHKRGY